MCSCLLLCTTVISSSYLFFPNAWSKVWAGIKQRYRIGKAVKVGVLRLVFKRVL